MSKPTNNVWAAMTLRRMVVGPFQKNRVLQVAAGLLAMAVGGRLCAADGAGAVRITDQGVVQAMNSECATCQQSHGVPMGTQCGPGMDGPVLELSGNPVSDWYRVHHLEKQLAKQCQDQACAHEHHHHFWQGRGHDCDGGNCYGSGGCPNGGCDDNNCEHRLHCPCGCCHLLNCGPYGCRFLDFNGYHMAYPVDPWYSDRRDSMVYAAAGYGAPMVVPLAPTVTNQYNYGWGIPSGRLTPISRVSAQPGVMAGAVAPR